MIIAYVGDVGSGKTANAVYDAMNACRHGRHVISNTPFDGYLQPHWFDKKIKAKAEFIPNGQQFQHALAFRENCIFLLDEAAVYLPNYYWSKLPPELIVKFAQNRKYNTDIWYTSQGFGMAVSRLRELTQRVYKCYATKILFQKCLVAKRFKPEYFHGEQTVKKYQRCFMGARTLYPAQLRQVFAAYDTHYVVDSSATMKVSGFVQPTWQKDRDQFKNKVTSEKKGYKQPAEKTEAVNKVTKIEEIKPEKTKDDALIVKTQNGTIEVNTGAKLSRVERIQVESIKKETNTPFSRIAARIDDSVEHWTPPETTSSVQTPDYRNRSSE